MRYRMIGTFALMIMALPGVAGAGTVALVSDKALCERAPSLEQAARIEVGRSGNTIILNVTAQLNCARIPGRPELREWRNAATLSLPTTSPSGMATTCVCAHTMTFEISDLYESVETIYYVQDGTALGHVDAP